MYFDPSAAAGIVDYVQPHLGDDRRRERRMQRFVVAVWPAFLILLAGAYIAINIAV